MIDVAARQAEIIIDVPKKVYGLMGIALESSKEGEKTCSNTWGQK